jgi:hypothetical protein
MKDADKQLLDGLALVTDLREDEWALVVSDVEKAGGVRQVSGMARVEIERAVAQARFLVDKARQPKDPKPKPVVPVKRKKQIIYTDGRRYSRAQMPLGADPSNYPTDKYELVNPDGTPFKKSVEPVVKHPGHADQSVHGGGRGKGGGAPSSSPASPAGGAGGSTAGDAGVAQAGKILSNAKDGAMYHDAGSIAQEKAMMGKTTKSDAIGRAHKHDQDFAVSMKDSNAYAERATAVRRAQPNNPKAEKMAQALDRDSRKFQTEAAISMSLASAWTSVAMDLGASESDLISNNRP